MKKFDVALTAPVADILDTAYSAGLNVLLTGMAGCGKTTQALDWTKSRGLKTKYFNGPTIDPYVHLIGVPDVTVKEDGTKHLQLVRPAFWDTVEVVIFDEINRANRDTRNALLELALFGTINGRPAPNLKMIIGMRNPDSGDAGFDVEVMDKALLERLPVQINVPQLASVGYFSKSWKDCYTEASLCAFTTQYNNLTIAARVEVSPRMLEDGLRMHYACQGKSATHTKYLINSVVSNSAVQGLYGLLTLNGNTESAEVQILSLSSAQQSLIAAMQSAKTPQEQKVVWGAASKATRKSLMVQSATNSALHSALVGIFGEDVVAASLRQDDADEADELSDAMLEADTAGDTRNTAVAAADKPDSMVEDEYKNDGDDEDSDEDDDWGDDGDVGFFSEDGDDEDDTIVSKPIKAKKVAPTAFNPNDPFGTNNKPSVKTNIFLGKRKKSA